MLPAKQARSYKAFYDAARNNGILEEKTTLLVHLAVGMTAGCYP
jgi:hypothetical protein